MGVQKFVLYGFLVLSDCVQIFASDQHVSENQDIRMQQNPKNIASLTNLIFSGANKIRSGAVASNAEVQIILRQWTDRLNADLVELENIINEKKYTLRTWNMLGRGYFDDPSNAVSWIINFDSNKSAVSSFKKQVYSDIQRVNESRAEGYEIQFDNEASNTLIWIRTADGHEQITFYPDGRMKKYYSELFSGEKYTVKWAENGELVAESTMNYTTKDLERKRKIYQDIKDNPHLADMAKRLQDEIIRIDQILQNQ